MNKEFKAIDIGHQGYSIDRAITELEIAVSDSIFSGDVKAIKIIHGHGTGALKKGVLGNGAIIKRADFQGSYTVRTIHCLIRWLPI